MTYALLGSRFQTNSSIPLKQFRLLRNFSVISLSGFAIAIYLLSIFYRQQAEHDLLISTEENNAALTQVLSNTLWPKYDRFLVSIRALDDEYLLSNSTAKNIGQDIRAQIKGTTIQKVKVFDYSGRVVFSTEVAQVGTKKGRSPGFLAAKSGQIVSQIGHRDTFQSLESTLINRHLLSSYIPIRTDGLDGDVVGVFEVYADVTPMLQRIEQTQIAISIGSSLILLTLYAVLYGFVRRADSVILNQYQQVKSSESRYRLQTKELEEALAHLKKTQAQMVQNEKMSSLGQMVAGIAHEINNPASFISGNVYPAKEYARGLIELINLYEQEYVVPSSAIASLKEDIDLAFIAEDFPRLLDSIKSGSQRIADIVQALRTFSRLDESDIKPVDIHLGIESTLMILQHRLKLQTNRAEIEVSKHFVPLPLVTCAASSINQVFMNILMNAIDAIEAASFNADQVPTITVSTELSSRSEVVVTIADNGLGMNQAVASRIFDPFFTTKPVGKGTGLGLSVSHTIVTEQHQGRLTCVSKQGKGTTFVVGLPV